MIDLDTASEEDVLARTIFGEARGEGVVGMNAVACVVVNRVANPRWWGQTVKEVCLKPYQFSCWNVGDPNRQVILNIDEGNAAYDDALAIARQAIAGTLPDITNGATNYYARGTPEPRWAFGKNPCDTIGRHIFFSDID